MESDDYFPFTGVNAALTQGDSRFASLSYELPGTRYSLGSGGGTAEPDPPAEPDYGYTGDLDCADFSGPVDVSGGDPHGLESRRINTNDVVQLICKHPFSDLQPKRWGTQRCRSGDGNRGRQNCDGSPLTTRTGF